MVRFLGLKHMARFLGHKRIVRPRLWPVQWFMVRPRWFTWFTWCMGRACVVDKLKKGDCDVRAVEKLKKMKTRASLLISDF